MGGTITIPISEKRHYSVNRDGNIMEFKDGCNSIVFQTNFIRCTSLKNLFGKKFESIIMILDSTNENDKEFISFIANFNVYVESYREKFNPIKITYNNNKVIIETINIITRVRKNEIDYYVDKNHTLYDYVNSSSLAKINFELLFYMQYQGMSTIRIKSLEIKDEYKVIFNEIPTSFCNIKFY